MSSSSSGKKLERFFTGKGFYIVLFLCAAVIGVSAWMMAAGNETMAKDVVNSNDTSYSSKRVETVIIPPADSSTRKTAAGDGSAVPAMKDSESTAEDTAGSESGDEAAAETGKEETAAVFAGAAENAAPVYLWPVSGNIERNHSMDRLSYDVTLRDWRTHDGIDIEAPVGTIVTATRGGTVESIVEDDLYGTVVTIDHGDGTKAVYANLAGMPAVNVNDAVEPGYIVGSVGTTALAEIGQGTHLHFALRANGASVDPLDYLQAA